MKTRRRLPRAPLTTDRRTGGAHTVKRELSAREELTLRLNEMHQDDEADAVELAQALDDVGFNSDPDDYYDYLLTKLETTHGRFDI
jgi:ABC-type transport system involved in cytochrome c biogenesis ATPase subunit